jgi:putative phage-type endonuclease
MEMISKPEHGSEQWLAIRKQDKYGRIRFGASEAPTLMGANQYATVADLALDKWSPAEVSAPNDAMVRGNVLEPALVAHAATLLGENVTTPEVMYSVGRLIATLDGITDDGLTIVECKTTMSYSSDDPIPPAYYWQAIAQLACVPTAESVLVVVLDKRMRLGTWTVNRDRDDIDRLFDRADYVGEYLDKHEMPPDAIMQERHVISMYPAPSGTVELGSDGLFILNTWLAAKEARTVAEKQEQEARDMLVALLGSAEAGTVDEQTVVTYKARKGSTTVDWKAVARDHGPLLDKYRKQGFSTRVLRSSI